MTGNTPNNLAIPPAARCAGLLAMAQGCLLVALCAGIDGLVLWKTHPSSQARIGYMIFSLLAAIPALLLPVGGALLAFGKRAGRTILLTYAWIAIPLMLIGLLISAAAFNAIESGNQPAHILLLFGSIAGASVFFTMVLTWLLLSGKTQYWSDAVLIARRPPPLPLPPGSVEIRQTQMTAILSVIFAFLPPPILMQMLSLGLGLQALGAIRRSGGRRTGRALAIVGCCMSMVTLSIVVMGAGAAVAGLATDSSTRQGSHLVSRRLLELNVAQQVYRNLKCNPQTPGADCTASVSDLLKATSELSPMDSADSAEVCAADATVMGERARPYHGYLFATIHFEDWGDQEPGKNWAILAWPSSSSFSLFPVSHDALMLDSDGRITSLKYTPGGIPQHISRSQIDQWREDTYSSIEESWVNDLSRRHSWSDIASQPVIDVALDVPPASDPGAALYRHGMAEAHLPGRELRALCWFKAYLAGVPQGTYADNARQQIDQINQSITDRVEAIFKRMGDLGGKLPEGSDQADALEKNITDLRDRVDSANQESASTDTPALSSEQRQKAWEDYEKEDLDDPLWVEAQNTSVPSSDGNAKGPMSFDEFSRRANEWVTHLIEIRQGAPEKPPEGATLLLHSELPRAGEF